LSTISRVIFILLCAWAAEVHAAAERPVILVFGDSLSAGYGLKETETGWVALLTRRMDAEGYRFDVVNASVSGETTDGGLARLPRALRLHKPAVVVLELAANDGLRALPVARTRRNLLAMIQLCKSANARVLVLGVRLPPNYGVRYNSDFEKMFASIAREERVAAVPWFMRNVADRPELMQQDGLHPNGQGQKPLLDNIWPVLLKLLTGNRAKAA
jgi:acyl-CoA thioesterase-1